MNFNIYTDGSSRGNPGQGGFGVVVMNEDNSKIEEKFSSQFENVTNNYMELLAIKTALEFVSAHKDDNFKIYSDSAYCVNICNNWIYSWKNNGWKRSKNQEIENLEIIKEIYNLLNKDFPNFMIIKVNGHNGNIGNELADSLATNNLTKFQKFFDKVNKSIDKETFFDLY